MEDCSGNAADGFFCFCTFHLSDHGSAVRVALMFWKAKWKKEAELLVKAARKFLHYKLDLLPEDRVREIETRIQDLRNAIKSGNRANADEAGKQLHSTCENALPYQKPQEWFAENVEVIFVALVVALGLRTFILQPFRIPTGSMQPTLNGIITDSMDEEEFRKNKPWVGKQVFDWVARSRRWREIESPTSGTIRAYKDKSLLFISRTEFVFDNGKTVIFPAPVNEAMSAIAGVEDGNCIGMSFKKGQTMFRGTVDGGDLVLVDKISYHFRSPKRGEVFVFDTIGLEKRIGLHTSTSASQAKATHYIKRLCGVPGDALRIESPHLMVNGKIASEPGIAKAMAYPNRSSSAKTGYSYAMQSHTSSEMSTAEETLELRKEAPSGLREYAALGDNSGNSLDSRYWGALKEYNLVGPALLSLWPFTTGHWGIIK